MGLWFYVSKQKLIGMMIERWHLTRRINLAYTKYTGQWWSKLFKGVRDVSHLGRANGV